MNDSAAPAVAPPGLAPTGRLRCALNLGNPLLVRRDAAGEPFGVSVDISRELARRLGVACEFLVSDTAAGSVGVVREGRADVGFFAVDPLRGQGILFTRPYLLIEGSYLVRGDSPLQENAQVDAPGRRVTVGAGSAYDLFLSRELKAATLVRAASSQAVVATFLANGDDVAAGVRQQLEADARLHPGLRLLPGRFMVIEQALGTPAARGEAAREWLAGCLEDLKASGFVAQALARHGVQGAVVAPARSD